MNQFKDILNEKEEVELRKMIDNKPLVGGLKKALLEAVYYSGTLKPGEEPEPRRNFVCQMLYTEDMGTVYKVSNEEIGERVRASVEGIRLIEQAFAKLEALREVKEVEEKKEPNPGS